MAALHSRAMIVTVLNALRRACLIAALACSAAAAEPPAPPHPAVTVEKDGKKVAIDVQMSVPVSQAIAWDVLTDFANMARYVPNVHSSVAVAEAPNVVRVTQKGAAHWGPLSFDFESVRRIVMQPMSRIESTTLSGKISKMTSLCEIAGVDDGARIHYHADAEIDFWLPPGLGTRAMRSDTEEQFTAMAAEMLRRAGLH